MAMRPPDSFTLIVIGTGFGSSFFLHAALARLAPDARVLVLERGGLLPPDWQIAHGRNSDIDSRSTIRVPAGQKPWQFTLAFGGGTNCWWGVTPRLHPSDFELRSRHGVGRDWPLSYDDLEPYYSRAEWLMDVAGDADNGVLFPRSAAYPQPPHVLSTVDERMKAAMPGLHFALPSARSSVPGARRGVCCGSARCNLCPTNARFNLFNGLDGTYDDPRVDLQLRAEVLTLEAEAGRIRRVTYRQDGQLREARGGMVVLGANAIFSAAILQRSGLDDGTTGRFLHEQLGAEVEVMLEGLDHFDGGTATTGINYALFDGPHRRDMSGVHVLFRNAPVHGLRLESGRWRQTLPLLLIAESLPDPEDRVTIDADDPRPRVSQQRVSEYARRGIERALHELPALLAPLPVERITVHGMRPDEAHVQGTLRMGHDPRDSVVDADLLHHRFRNLVVVGTAVMPGCATANPSLTAAALALRSAERLL
jgi:choline dehydrogenase-like flavoprotein